MDKLESTPRNYVILVSDKKNFLSKSLQKTLSDHEYNLVLISQGEHLPNLLERQGHPVDLIILDTKPLQEKGIYWLKWLKQYHPSILTIISSTETDQDSRLCALENGADDYIIKPFHDAELLFRIDKAFKGKQQAICAPITIGRYELNVVHNELSDDSQTITLTTMETKILQFLHLNAGKTISRDEMNTHLWGVHHHSHQSQNRTVDTHISKLRKKIERDSRNPRYIRTIRGQGYRLYT